jgi:hypothetical protein
MGASDWRLDHKPVRATETSEPASISKEKPRPVGAGAGFLKPSERVG